MQGAFVAKNALIFADGKLGVGLGHISRCRALKSELESLGFVVELKDTQELEEEFKKLESQRALRQESKEKYCSFLWDLIVIDSYVLGVESYKSATQFAKVCLFFDDTLRLNYPEAILLNNARSADLSEYKAKYPKHQLFLGNSYRLLQTPFAEVLESPAIPLNLEIKKVLITLGGSDLLGLNAPLLVALRKAYPHLELHCIAKDSLEDLLDTPLRGLSKERGVSLHYGLSAREMVALIRQMDLCICACGQSLGEILVCGIPAIALEVAANQKANLTSFASCILSIREAYLMTRDRICQKVLEHLESYASLTLRTTHQTRALEILRTPTKWKESIEAVFC